MKSATGLRCFRASATAAHYASVGPHNPMEGRVSEEEQLMFDATVHNLRNRGWDKEDAMDFAMTLVVRARDAISPARTTNGGKSE